METTMTPREVLLLPMGTNDADAATVGGYLQSLLKKLWEKGDGFSGKRPFGNSGWEHELYMPLIAAGATTGTLDDDGYVREEGNAAQVVRDAIDALFPEAWGAEEGRRIIAALLRAKTDDISDV